MMQALQRLLFRRTLIAPLVFLRIVFGVLAFADTCGLFFYYHLRLNRYAYGEFHFTYAWFSWVRPLPEPWMSLLFIIMLVSAACVAMGYRYKWAAGIFAFLFCWVFLIEKALYLNHGYLFCVLSIFMALTPAHRAFSVDVLRRPDQRLTHIPFFYILVPLGMMSIVYFYGGLAKLNPDWLQAVPLRQWLSGKSQHYLQHWMWLGDWGLGDFMEIANERAGTLLRKQWLAFLLSWGGVTFDLGIVFLLAFRRTRVVGFVLVLFFHLTNHLIFNIGIFPFLSIALSALFFPADFPLRVIRFLGKRWAKVRRCQYAWYRKLRAVGASNQPVDMVFTKLQKNGISAVLILFFAYLLISPFRHWVYGNEVAWTEEGHRFAWRMMLRSKSGYGAFTVQNPVTQQRERVDLKKHLNDRQARKIFGQPDMILEFAHYLDDYYQSERGWEEVSVFANIHLRLNNRQHTRFVSDTVDLSEQHLRLFHHAPWILPSPPWKKAD